MSTMNTCTPKPPLAHRSLLSSDDADQLAVMFKSLSHPTRLRIIHCLIRCGECSVGDLADQVEMTVQAVSNQLQRLAEISVVDCRKEGVQVFYRVIDPCVPALLERGWCHVEEYESGKLLSGIELKNRV